MQGTMVFGNQSNDPQVQSQVDVTPAYSLRLDHSMLDCNLQASHDIRADHVLAGSPFDNKDALYLPRPTSPDDSIDTILETVESQTCTSKQAGTTTDEKVKQLAKGRRQVQNKNA